MEPIREELSKLKNTLEDDLDEFNYKLNSVRENLSRYIDQQIEYLINIKNEFNDEFNYLEEENIKTCQNNQHEFNKLCLIINQNDHDQTIASKLLERFKQTFPLRPKMLKSIPEYHFKDIQFDDFIIKQNSSVINEPLRTENSFVPINEQASSSFPKTSIGSSYHKQLASQNNEDEIEPQSRLVSTCSTINGIDNMVNLLFKINYQHNRSQHLMCYNEEENCLLVYSFSPHQFEYLPLNTREISLISLPFSEPILNLGYSTKYRLFYLSIQQKNSLILFRINEKEKQIVIEEEIKLINEKDHLISAHIYENLIFFIYLSLSIVMFGKYDIETSSFLPPISLKNKLYDNEEKCSYVIIDFTINNSFICCLTRLKTKSKYMIVIYDEDLNKLNSFDLIDAIKPLSIISTEKKFTSSITTTTTISNDDIQSLLFINDLKSHLIHCCTYQAYLIPIQVNAFGICSLNDGNLSLVAREDIRGLNIQDYLQTNNVHLE